MAWRPHGFARVNPSKPEGFAYCERCGMLYNLVDLVFQWEWRGPNLMNTWHRVCKRTCLDTPADFLKTIILPADPEPLWQPRPENLIADEGGLPGPPSAPLIEVETGGLMELESGAGFFELEDGP